MCLYYSRGYLVLACLHVYYNIICIINFTAVVERIKVID